MVTMSTATRRMISLLVGLSVLQSCTAQSSRIRFCIPHDLFDYCIQMSNSLSGSIGCIRAKDIYECMALISRDQADVINVGPEDLFLAGKMYNLVPILMEEYNKNLFRYSVVALVRKNSDINSLGDLRGKRSCHTGFDRTAGWNVPIGNLLNDNVMTPNCEGELHTVEDFFSRSCVPGKWSQDPNVDRQWKQMHPKLCAVCKDPSSCSATDQYAGHTGAIRCLVEGDGEVAFTTAEAVTEYFRERNDIIGESDYQFLCMDGQRKSIRSSRTNDTCEWARQPTNAIISRELDEDTSRLYQRYLSQIFFRFQHGNQPAWFSKIFISDPEVTQLVPVISSRQSWDTYLGRRYIPSIERALPGCERANITFCVTSADELRKCLELQRVAYAHRIQPDIRCRNAGDTVADCVQAIHERKADVIGLDMFELYTAARYYGLVPIAAQQINESDYAVAVIRSDSHANSLADLKEMRSCHSGIDSKTGWMLPVGILLQDGIISPDHCSRPLAVTEFFTGGSCVPGASDYHLNANVSGAQLLCQQCAGDVNGEHRCERSSIERYNDEVGAFRCLLEGHGDVAFLNYQTPLKYLANEGRNFGLHPNQFRLLCRTGGQRSIYDYKMCHLSEIKAEYVAAEKSVRLAAAHLVAQLNYEFKRRSPYSYRLFGDNSAFDGEANLIFDDRMTELLPVDEVEESEDGYDLSDQEMMSETFRKLIGSDMFRVIESLDERLCSSGSQIPLTSLTALIVSVVGLLTYY